jgi:hypothetical protein
LRIDRFDIVSRSQGSYILQHNLWDKKLEVKWNILNVYGAAQEEHKEAFLTELASFCSKNKDPFIVGGDFNILRFSLEKNRNFHPNKFTELFNIIINSNELREISLSGGIFT